MIGSLDIQHAPGANTRIGASGRIRTDDRRFTKATSNELIHSFIASRREGLSIRTIEDTYKCYLNLSREVVGLDVTGQDIQRFLARQRCTDGGKHAFVLPGELERLAARFQVYRGVDDPADPLL